MPRLKMVLRQFIALTQAFALLLGAGVVPASAQQPNRPGPDWYELAVRGPADVCTNDEVTYTVDLYAVVTEPDGSQQLTRYPGSGVQIAASFAGGTVSGAWTPIAGMSFPARFASPGDYTITVSGSSVPVLYTTLQQRVPARDGQWVVHVRDCHYSVSTLSVWIINDGFRPWMAGVLDRIPLTQTSPINYEGAANLVVTAIPRATFGCTKVAFDVGDVNVSINAQIGDEETSMFVFLSYGQGVASLSAAGVRCGLPGHSQPSPFSLDTVRVWFPRNGIGYAGVHESSSTLHAYVEGPGRTFVILERGP